MLFLERQEKKDKANLCVLTLGIYYRADTGYSNDFPLDWRSTLDHQQ